MNRRTIISGAMFGGVAAVAGKAVAQVPTDTHGADLDAKSEADDLFNKLISEGPSFTVKGNLAISNYTAPFLGESFIHIKNNGRISCTLRVTSKWTGSREKSYINNDTSLYEVFNDVKSDSSNRSWAGSFANAWNNIPAGVTDGGTRVGVIGWATSVNNHGYKHEGTLNRQIGLHGRAGFQSAGSGSEAIIEDAIGVLGEVLSDSEGSTIVSATAGSFVSAGKVGRIKDNYAVYASAKNGETSNYSFYGAAGTFYNEGPVAIGNKMGQSKAQVSVRKEGNAYEFGHPDQNGYGNNLGATQLAGYPFLALCAEVELSGDTYRTRGKPGTLIWNNLAGEMVFSRLPDPDASGQAPVESARFEADGHLVLAETPILKRETKQSSNAPGKVGEMCWDEDYVYICVAPDTWKRAVLSNW
ncbi:hypothetical protein [Phyllobacterium leguminum]|uniref:Uncharacterized protein n=1 Tax=Phyllobacterium leguminum TaxID=314237 RepID=A0A318TG81_9HYPH|nr:hypothetical protein [Phyllobacterium leguminum]PYE87603.1 hypothetical protein C7477_112106 [Phyllobacterium leguminum]